MGETGEEKRSKTLTPTRQTSDKLFCGHSPPPQVHLVCISLRLQSSPGRLSLLLSPTHSLGPTPLLGPIQPGLGPRRN